MGIYLSEAVIKIVRHPTFLDLENQKTVKV